MLIANFSETVHGWTHAMKKIFTSGKGQEQREKSTSVHLSSSLFRFYEEFSKMLGR